MRRWLAMLVLAPLLVGCGSGDDAAAPPATETTVAAAPTTTVTTATPSTTSRAAAVTTTTGARPTAATALIEPDTVAGLPLGSTKSQAIAVLGPATRSGQETDLSGRKYDYLGWEFSGNRGLILSYGTDSVTSPLLTDWKATAPGPTTKGGVQVGDGAAKVTAAYGPLQPFCCDTRVAAVDQGVGRMMVVVGNASQKVDQIFGGDPAYWQRKIAD